MEKKYAVHSKLQKLQIKIFLKTTTSAETLHSISTGIFIS